MIIVFSKSMVLFLTICVPNDKLCFKFIILNFSLVKVLFSISGGKSLSENFVMLIPYQQQLVIQTKVKSLLEKSSLLLPQKVP